MKYFLTCFTLSFFLVLPCAGADPVDAGASSSPGDAPADERSGPMLPDNLSPGDRPAKQRVPLGSADADAGIKAVRAAYLQASAEWAAALRQYLMTLDEPNEQAISAFTRANFETYLDVAIKRERHAEAVRAWQEAHETYVPGMDADEVRLDPAEVAGMTPEERLEFHAYRRASEALLSLESRAEATNNRQPGE